MTENKRGLLTLTKPTPTRVGGLSVDVAPPLSLIAYRYSYLLLLASVNKTAPSFGKYALHKFTYVEHIAIRKHAYSVKRGTICQLCKSAEMLHRHSEIYLFA